MSSKVGAEHSRYNSPIYRQPHIGNALPYTLASAPILKPQGKFIRYSEEGLAFADRDFGGKLENSSANAKPLQITYGFMA
ncbi:hypothetical protein HCU40_11550 [Pseudanabaena biceps]|nr:hypothetical protein [Pseudanabaena biceps]